MWDVREIRDAKCEEGPEARREAIARLRRNDRVEGVATWDSYGESEMRLRFLPFASIDCRVNGKRQTRKTHFYWKIVPVMVDKKSDRYSPVPISWNREPYRPYKNRRFQDSPIRFWMVLNSFVYPHIQLVIRQKTVDLLSVQPATRTVSFPLPLCLSKIRE